MNRPLFKQDMLPNFNNVDPTKIASTVEEILTQHRARLATLLSQPQPYTWDNLLQPLEEMSDELAKYWSTISHMRSVVETDELRKAFNETLPKLIEYNTEMAQNEQLYKATLLVNNSHEFSSLSPAQKKIIENDIRDFKLAGIHLSADKKARLAALEQEHSRLTTKYSENLLDATHAWTLHITDAKKMAGLPEQALQLAIDNAKQRQLEGYVFTLDYPSYSTALKYLDDRAIRKTLYEAYATRASDRGPTAGKFDNTKIMEEILTIRHEIAHLVGFKNYVEYSLATKMAKTPEDVLHFLYDLLKRSKPIAEEEYQEIATLAKELDGIEKLEVWDSAYYSEKLRESKFNFTQEELRPYFPVDKVLSGLFTIVKKLYNIRIERQTNVSVWHPQAEFYVIYDDKDEIRAGFYIDLYAREHKRDGAWMDECRSRHRDNKGLQYPVAYLTCNFMPPLENQPALLTHDDVITVFHEFGHCLHHMLTKVDYPSVSGINGVPWDAVEFPSQFMENFCWEKASLDMIAGHYQTGAPLPDALYEKMLAAKHFQTGLQMVRQIEFSLFDFELHLEYQPGKPHQVQTILDRVRSQAAVFRVPEFNRFQHSFSHIFAGGYAAGYYSYKWADVLSSDAYAEFEEKGIFDSATGKSFMENILEIGGVRDPMASFVAFRGREPRIDALLKQNGMIKPATA